MLLAGRGLLAARAVRVLALVLSLVLTSQFRGLDGRLTSAQAQTRTASPPITATAGQVIRGVRITSTSGPCITINNVADVWVDDVELGPCGPGGGVHITGLGATGIRVTNSLIHTERAGPGDSGVGVYISGASNVLVQGNQFSYNESHVYAIGGSNIRIIGNYGLNPLGPFPRGNFVQFNGVQGGEVSDNYGESRSTDVVFPSGQEDAINLWESRNVQVLRNYLVGGNPGGTMAGCGIITDGTEASNNTIADNVLIRTAQCGIGIAAGVNNVVTGNKVLDTNFPGAGGNIGVYVWNQYPGSCSGIRIENNIVSNRLPDGTYNDYWDAGNCGLVVFTGNILGSAARLLLTPEAEKLPRPPIPPRPYVVGQGPYGGTPRAIPGLVQAEDYDTGGEGVAYHDMDAANLGGAYRTDGVDIGMTVDVGGGFYVGWMQAGEWLKYTVNVAQAGAYDIQVRVGSALAGRTFHIEFNGVDKTGPRAVPVLPGWDQYQTVTIPGVSLGAGIQVMRVVMGPLDSMDLNWVSISAPAPLDIIPPAVALTAPASGTTISGTITVSASASDNVGVVGVQFFVDTTLLGDDTAAPYGVSWNTTLVSNGSHTLTAVARDAAGNRTTSAAVMVMVSNVPPDTTAPTVNITTPAAGATVTGTTNVSVDASDNVGVVGVQFFVDTTLLGDDTAAPYGVSWNTTLVSNGSHTLTAVARDAAGNRTTSAAVSVTVSNTPNSAPYGGTPRAIPGVVQAEDYDTGGEGVAYHDLDAANLGGAYRTDGVDIRATADGSGGYYVGWFQAGEWLKYTVNVAQTGTYDIKVRVGSALAGRTFHIEFNGVDKTGPVAVPVRSGWDRYKTVTIPGVSLSAGIQVMRVVMGPLDSMDLNWISIWAPGQGPLGGLPWAIPGLIQAEDYDTGGEGVAYHDLDAANLGGAYRTDGVDIRATADGGGGYYVGWFQAEEWLNHTVNVAEAGTYDIKVRVGSALAGRTFHIEFNGVDKTGPVAVPVLPGWDQYQTVTIPGISLSAGIQVMRVVMGPLNSMELNWIAIATAFTAAVTASVEATGGFLVFRKCARGHPIDDLQHPFVKLLLPPHRGAPRAALA